MTFFVYNKDTISKNKNESEDGVMKRMANACLACLVAICVLVSLLPMTAMETTAATYFDESDLGEIKCTILSNSARKAYVERMMKYHILSETDNYRVARNLQNVDSVVFFFDGCSDNVDDAKWSDYTKYRLSAYCAVVQLKNGVPTVVFESENNSTIPDNPRNPATNEGTPVPTVRDGVYNIISTNHGGSYAALRIQDNSGSVPVVRCTATESYISTSSAINIHARSQFSGAPTDGITPTSYSSAGCFNVGRVSDSWAEYNKFINAVLGIAKARSSSGNTKCDTGIDHGIVIIDRTNYRTQLEQIYAKNGVPATEIVSQLTEYTDKILEKLTKRGDVDGNGKIDAKDYLMAKRCVLGTYTPTETQKAGADVDGNGKIEAKDYLKIKGHVLGTYTIE